MKPLHPIEKKLLSCLISGESILEEISEKSSITLDQARRALERLKTKKYVVTEDNITTIIALGDEGKKAAEQGLPERILVNSFSDNKSLEINSLKDAYSFEPNTFSTALGKAKNLGWIKVISNNGQVNVELLNDQKITNEEKLLTELQSRPIKLNDLDPSLIDSLKLLTKRPDYIITKTSKEVIVKATNEGIEVLSNQKDEEVDLLTTDDIITQQWKSLKLRSIDVEAPPPLIYPGKKHLVQDFIDEAKEIFTTLGFEEIEGPISQISFWNFDALFTPQDHPAREMQDTFYLENIKSNNVTDQEILKNVKEVHQNGGKTGSRGWGGKWSDSISNQSVLRTHTTALTVRYLAEFKPKESKIFSIGKIFRNEKLSYKHLAEFHQYEGIVVDENVTMRDLMGVMSIFYKRLGFKKIKFWPTFFPYTEPSLQAMVYHESIGKWIELCGMGIFRPEVTIPLGVNNPVLAWGGGLERLIMLRYDLTDIRQLYRNNLDWIRENYASSKSES